MSQIAAFQQGRELEHGMDVGGQIRSRDGVVGGTLKVVGGRASSNVAASSAITNTTTETVFDEEASLPANTLKAGTVVRIWYQGIATATNSTDTLIIKLIIDGTASTTDGTDVITTNAIDVADNDIFVGCFTLICRTPGAAGTVVGFGQYQDPDAADTTLQKAAFLASTVVDTTAATPIKVSAEWSVANAGNSCRLDVLAVEVF